MSTPAGTPGIQRAAALLLSLEKQEAAALLKHLDPEVLSDVAAAMTALGATGANREQVDAVYLELAREALDPSPSRPRSAADLRALMQAAVGERRADEMLREIEERRLHERPFLEIEQHPPERVAVALASESEAVAALVLAHFEPARSASVLAGLPPERAMAVVKRLATIVPPSFETLRSVAAELQKDLERLAGERRAPERAVRLRGIAEVLGKTGTDLEKSILEGITAADQAMAKEIREYMFTWDDLAGLDKRSMQKVLGAVNTASLAVALKGATPAVEQNVLANLSARSRAMVQEEREMAGAVPRAQVNASRAEIMQAVRQLMDAGEFKPARGGGDELVS